jgi:hypothetical protein
MRRPSIAAALALSLACGAARADLVTNGGFESGFSGWTQFGNTGNSGIDNGVLFGPPHGGSLQAYFGNVGSTGGISQTLAADAGDTVFVSFWLFSPGGGTATFDCSLDGVSIQSLTNPAAFGYTRFTGTVTVANANPSLVFTFRHDPDFWRLDDVAATIVPLPPGVVLAGGGLVSLGVLAGVRRRRRARN